MACLCGAQLTLWGAFAEDPGAALEAEVAAGRLACLSALKQR